MTVLTFHARPSAVQPTPEQLRDVAGRAPRRPFDRGRFAAGTVLVLLAVAAASTLAGSGLNPAAMMESWGNAERFFARVGGITFAPLSELLYLSALTLGLVICGTLLAALISVPVAYLAAANTTPHPALRTAARFVGVLARALPDVVLAIVFVLIFSLGTLPGILAIGIHSIGMISKMFADAIEQIDEGPRTAIRAAGGTKQQEFVSGVLPQVLPSWIATTLHRNDINLRGSVLLGYVGVAGLGLEMSHAFKALDYSLGLGYAAVIFLLCVLMEIVSSTVRAHLLRGSAAGDTADFAPRTPAEALRRPWTAQRVIGQVWGWAALLVVIGSLWICNIKWSDLLTVWGKIPEQAAKFWPPSFGTYGPQVLVPAMGETIAIALAATLLALGGSLIVGSLAARNVAPNPGVRSGFRLLLVGIRGVPEIILALVLIVITGLGQQAGMLALAFGGIGLLGKLIADSFEEVPSGPETALRTTGATRLQVYAGATFPQGARALIAHVFYMLDSNIRSATTLGIVGAGGIGYYLLNASEGARYDQVTMIVAMVLVTVLVVELVAMWMRKVFN